MILINFPNYEVSTFWNVRNRQTGKILKQSIDKDGYEKVNIYSNCISITKKIHRLVASAFLNNHENKKNVDHIDRDRSNNNIGFRCAMSAFYETPPKTGLFNFNFGRKNK